MGAALGNTVLTRLHPEWQAQQAQVVWKSVTDLAETTSVAEHKGAVRGFVVVALHADSPVGQIDLIAVDPDHQ